MTFGRRDKQVDKTTIHYNSHLTLTGLPREAYDYVVNGKPAIEWIMERYQVTVDKASGIRNDPNDWAREHDQPRYIVDLLKRVVRVSMETMKIVQSLPSLNEAIPTESEVSRQVEKSSRPKQKAEVEIPVLALDAWRTSPMKRPLHTRQKLGDRYQSAIVEELIVQVGVPASFDVFRRAYWLLTQPDKLTTWMNGAFPQFGAREWRLGFGESLPTNTFFAHLKAMIQQGQLQLRTLDGEVCIVEAKVQSANIAHVIGDARMAILAAEANTSTNVVPDLSAKEKKELVSLINF